MNVGETVTALTQDEMWLEVFKEKNEAAFYIECGVMRHNDEDTYYYALVMPRVEYDELLDKVNEDVQRNLWVQARQEGRDEILFEPYQVLPWEIFISQPGCVGGMPTRKAAVNSSVAHLVASGKAYHK